MIKNIKNKKLISPKPHVKDYIKKTNEKYISPHCIENYLYSTLQDQHKQIIKYNKSINHKNNYFLLYKKVLFTHLILKKSSRIKIY